MHSLLLLLPLLVAAGDRYRASEIHMGTRFTITLHADDEASAREAFQAAFDRIEELDGRLSDYQQDSELNRLCRQAPTPEPVKISGDLYRVLSAAEQVSRQSEGGFDVTVGPLTRLWRTARRQKALPEKDALAKALDSVGYQHVMLSEKDGKYFAKLTRPGMQLDLGGIAKGYALDRAGDILEEAGLELIQRPDLVVIVDGLDALRTEAGHLHQVGQRLRHALGDVFQGRQPATLHQRLDLLGDFLADVRVFGEVGPVPGEIGERAEEVREAVLWDDRDFVPLSLPRIGHESTDIEIKDVHVADRRYVVCRNPEQAEQVKTKPKAIGWLVGQEELISIRPRQRRADERLHDDPAGQQHHRGSRHARPSCRCHGSHHLLVIESLLRSAPRSRRRPPRSWPDCRSPVGCNRRRRCVRPRSRRSSRG